LNGFRKLALVTNTANSRSAGTLALLLLDLVPERRGMASSVQSFISAVLNGLVAGVLAPLVMHSSLGLALASAALMLGGLVTWAWAKGRLLPATL
jgi:DHA1 family bicyclomycin/chloramphenicol resistance-like MFS transporter